jgi:hypothetical protein
MRFDIIRRITSAYNVSHRIFNDVYVAL